MAFLFRLNLFDGILKKLRNSRSILIFLILYRTKAGAYNRWGKQILFSFLNQDYAEKNEEDEKNTLNSSYSSSSA